MAVKTLRAEILTWGQFTNKYRSTRGTRSYLVDSWDTTFPGIPFPKHLENEDIFVIISYRLLYKDTIRAGREFTEKFLQNYKASKLLSYNKRRAVTHFTVSSRPLFRYEAIARPQATPSPQLSAPPARVIKKGPHHQIEKRKRSSARKVRRKVKKVWRG